MNLEWHEICLAPLQESVEAVTVVFLCAVDIVRHRYSACFDGKMVKLYSQLSPSLKVYHKSDVVYLQQS